MKIERVTCIMLCIYRYYTHRSHYWSNTTSDGSEEARWCCVLYFAADLPALKAAIFYARPFSTLTAFFGVDAACVNA
jgi:hypothetical protein